MAVRPIPQGYHSVTPYLICNGAARAIDFYKKAFGATEVMRMPMQNGKIMHAEIKIGDSHIMLADEQPDRGARAPQHYGGSPVSLLLYVENADKVVQQASTAGAKVTKQVQDEFYGDRSGALVDPFGHTWNIHTHVKDVTPEEMEKHMHAMHT
jgi:PhnB protein